MNCDRCAMPINEGMQVLWNNGNYHASYSVDAVNINRVVIPSRESNLSDNFFQQIEDMQNEGNEVHALDFPEDDFDELLEEPEVDDEVLNQIPVISSNGNERYVIVPNIVQHGSQIEIPRGGMIVAPRAIIYPPANGGGSHGTLVAGLKGSRYVEHPELKTLPLPEATPTFKPIPFYDFVTKVLDGLYDRRMRTVNEQYIISADGMKLFGLLELENEFDGVRFAVGLRLSNDKSMKLALACGYRVMCCSNGMLSGDFMPLAVKHSANLDIDDSLSLGIDRIRRRFGNLQLEIAEKKAKVLTDGDAESIIYKAFTYGKFPISLFRTVHQEYFVEPSYKEFAPRTLFSLENAFTSSFKKLQPMQQFEATSKLAKFLLEHRN